MTKRIGQDLREALEQNAAGGRRDGLLAWQAASLLSDIGKVESQNQALQERIEELEEARCKRCGEWFRDSLSPTQKTDR